jgi:hypothetical protein
VPQILTDEEFKFVWESCRGDAKKVSELSGITLRQVYNRRRYLEGKYSISLKAKTRPAGNYDNSEKIKTAERLDKLAETRQNRYEKEMGINVKNGVVLVGSDAHYWPLIVSKAHEAFCKLAKQLSPSIVVLNGDILDGARISRHPRNLWEKQPSLKDELAAVQDRCAEIERAAPKAALIRTIGNHDARFERYLCENAPELEEMSGSTLLDYLPRWRAGWTVHINAQTEGWTVIRHRPVSGGIHSAYNSVLRSGVNYVHGHLHKLEHKPWGDYRGRHWGIDCGTLADPKGPQFNYTEAGPLNWGSGFYVLTYRDGLMLPPEPCIIEHERAWFRGKEV